MWHSIPNEKSGSKSRPHTHVHWINDIKRPYKPASKLWRFFWSPRLKSYVTVRGKIPESQIRLFLSLSQIPCTFDNSVRLQCIFSWKGNKCFAKNAILTWEKSQTLTLLFGKTKIAIFSKVFGKNKNKTGSGHSVWTEFWLIRWTQNGCFLQ